MSVINMVHLGKCSMGRIIDFSSLKCIVRKIYYMKVLVKFYYNSPEFGIDYRTKEILQQDLYEILHDHSQIGLKSFTQIFYLHVSASSTTERNAILIEIMINEKNLATDTLAQIATSIKEKVRCRISFNGSVQVTVSSIDGRVGFSKE